MTKPKKLEGLQPRRKRLGLTQADVADALGVERATVGMWETGTSWPSARVLPDLAGLLCCSIDELYEAPEELPQPSPQSPAQRVCGEEDEHRSERAFEPARKRDDAQIGRTT